MKGEIDIKVIKKIAVLAKLNFDENELETFQKKLSSVATYVEELNEVPTETVEPTSQVTGLTNVFREDEVKPSLSQEEALANAKETYKGYFKVPYVFEEHDYDV